MTRRRSSSRPDVLVWLLIVGILIVAVGYGGFHFFLKSPTGLVEEAAAAQARASVRVAEATKQAAARQAAQAEQQRLVSLGATEQAVSAAATAVVVNQERSVQQTQAAWEFNVEQTQVVFDQNVAATGTAVVVHQTQAANDALATIAAGMATATQRAYEQDLAAIPLTATAQQMKYEDRAANRKVYGGLVVLLAVIFFWLVGLTYLYLRGTVPQLRKLKNEVKEWGRRGGRLTRRVDGLEQRWEGHDAMDLTITEK